MKTNYLQTKNKNGISVNICCGSCCHKYKDDAIRNYLCRQENRESNGGDCENWRMTRRLRGAHLSEGRIKKKEYLMFLLKIRETVLNYSIILRLKHQCKATTNLINMTKLKN